MNQLTLFCEPRDVVKGIQHQIDSRPPGWYDQGPDRVIDLATFIKADEGYSGDTLCGKPPKARSAVSIDGRLWVTTGACHVGIDSDPCGNHVSLQEIVPETDWPGPTVASTSDKGRRPSLYYGLRITCGKRPYVVGAARMTLRLSPDQAGEFRIHSLHRLARMCGDARPTWLRKVLAQHPLPVPGCGQARLFD